MRTKRLAVAMLCVLTAPGVVLAAEAEPEAIDLITEEEALELRLTDEEWAVVDRPRGVPPGPRIVVHQPKLGEGEAEGQARVATPFSLRVDFEENRAAVDMDSLDVFARRKNLPFKIRLTRRLEPYVKGQGIDASRLKVPSGKYLIGVTIADVNGRVTDSSFYLEVE